MLLAACSISLELNVNVSVAVRGMIELLSVMDVVTNVIKNLEKKILKLKIKIFICSSLE